MIPDLIHMLNHYIDEFNRTDEEIYPQEIPNRDAFDYLAEQIPLLDCPDPVIERTYYYRWWTFRKHWKSTPRGHILSEFLPNVRWAGPYNSISCAAGHHLREGRWLKDSQEWLKEYIRFWLNGCGNTLSYNWWPASAVADYLCIHPDADFERECLSKLVPLYRQQQGKSMHSCGLYWSQSSRDGMEYSISGNGIRPTLNSYMYGDAMAISGMAERTGQTDLANEFAKLADELKKKINLLLWDNDFYRTIPCDRDEPLPCDHRPSVDMDHRVRELVGYIPWYFGLGEEDKVFVFKQLRNEKGFLSPYGLTTAEQRHPRFLFKHEHECLWNGYIWPFATSQTLTAAANMMRDCPMSPLSREDYYSMLYTYATSHHRITETGESVPWIDEVMNPRNGEWSARRLLQEDNWNPQRGGYERGKYYNHSTFCDLVLHDLLGISFQEGQPIVEPLIPENWSYFCVTHLTQNDWTIFYDKNGSRYGEGAGLHYFKK